MLYLICNFFIGACLASHALVVYQRYDNAAYLFSHSRCDYCKFDLPLYDLIPLVSFILLKGKCRICKENIPIETFSIELIGGLAFMTHDFSSLPNYANVIFTFYFLLISIFDCFEQEFPTILLMPLFLLSIIHYRNLLQIEIIFSLPIILSLSLLIYQRKIGSGDLLLYLILVLKCGAFMANQILLLACLIAIIFFLIEAKRKTAFVPFIFTAFIIITTI